MNMTIAVTMLLAFCASVLFLYGAYLLWDQMNVAGTEQVKRRLRLLSAAGADKAKREKIISLAKEKSLSPLDSFVLGLPRLRHMDSYLEQAGLAYGPAGFLGRTLIAVIPGLILGMFVFRGLGNLAMPMGIILTVMIYWLRVSKRRKKRLVKIVEQLPDAMDFFARSLRAGNPFVGAMRSAPEEMQDPIASELGITFEELNYGLEFEDAMQNLASRTGSEEVRFFVTAVLVQKSTGGNLAEIMNRIAALLRERIRMRGEVKVQASEMKMSAHVLLALPFAIAGVLQLVNPDYFQILFETSMGRGIIGAQLVLMLFGYLILRKMVNFRI